jgi:hypothetical protein
MELVQFYLKGYYLTWWRIVREEEGKTHGFTWEFFKERIKLKFIPINLTTFQHGNFMTL